jgi:hypothetical protein
MSADVDQLGNKLAELQAARATLQATRTRDDADAAAKQYAETVRKTHAEVGGFILGGAILGDPMASVLRAFIVSPARVRRLAGRAGQGRHRQR